MLMQRFLTRLSTSLLTALLVLVFPTDTGAASHPTAFSYQGLLRADDANTQGAFDFKFTLFSSAADGESLAAPLLLRDVPVNAGLFTVLLDFGLDPFHHPDLWLDIAVQPHQEFTNFVHLSPRQPLLPVPQALHARGADHAAQAELALTVPAGSVTAQHLAEATLTADRIASGQVVTRLNGLQDEIILSAGPNLSLATNGQTLILSSTANWRLDGNSGTSPATHFLGTTDSQPLELRVNNVRALRLSPGSHPSTVNILGGSPANFINPNISGGTIAGGGASYGAGGDPTNSVYSQFGTIVGGYGHLVGTNAAFSFIGGGRSNFIGFFAYDSTVAGGYRNSIGEDSFAATVAGGRDNQIGDANRDATIGGGSENRLLPLAFVATIAGGSTNTIGPAAHAATISGGARSAILDGARFATISGGGDNFIHEYSFSSVIGGGGDNHVRSSSERSTIAGGKWNQVGTFSPHATIGGGFTNRIGPNAHAATIPGGDANRADGRFAFAAGQRAHALHSGTFVWADATKLDFPSTTTNEFSVRALGGVRFVSAVEFDGAPAAGVSLEPGGGSWSSLSDRNAKENFDHVDPQAVLNQLVGLPIHSWNYKSQSPDIRHIGPTAQDFLAAFAIGSDPRRITTVDAYGVALAAIQGLHQLVEERNDRIESLEQQNQQLEARLSSLEAMLLDHQLSRLHDSGSIDTIR
jgi:trimeric autotransporter adhesin